MKTSKRNFVDICISRAIALGVFSLACISGTSYAASDNGCGISNNSYINPEIALCSTHVYNIRQTQNPSDAASKQAMRDVIALKTTLITQQLEQQYNFLEATVSRLKTQLRKAVLTTDFEAAGASSESSSSSSTGDRNIYLAGTSNCNNESTVSGVFTCLRNNYNLIYNMSNGGTNLTTELRKQLAQDCSVVSQNASVAGLNADTLKNISVDNSSIDCTLYNKIKSRNEFQKCMEAINVQIRNATTYLTQQQQKNQQTRI